MNDYADFLKNAIESTEIKGKMLLFCNVGFLKAQYKELGESAFKDLMSKLDLRTSNKGAKFLKSVGVT